MATPPQLQRTHTPLPPSSHALVRSAGAPQVDPSSSIFDPPSRTAAQLTWRTVALTVAAVSVVLTVVGTVACVYVSHRHAEYLNTHYEYQSVKVRQLSTCTKASTASTCQSRTYCK